VIRPEVIRATGGPRDWLKWSENPFIYQYFVLRGPPKDYKWSTHRKSLGTTRLAKYFRYQVPWSSQNH